LKIYAIGGLGTDERVFQFLDLDYELIVLPWIPNEKNESLPEYARRMSVAIDTRTEFGIMGVSFGGMLAVEISKTLKPQVAILISSAETRNELRLIYRLVGQTGLLKLIPTLLYKPPKTLAVWLFGAENKAMLSQILSDLDLPFARWAMNAIATWNNEEGLSTPILRIHGGSDMILPYIPSHQACLIEKAGHFIIVDKAKDISDIINSKVSEYL